MLTVCFVEWSGEFVCICLYGNVIGNLDGIFDGEVPEFGGKKMFCEIVAGDVTDVAPVALAESILTLAATGCTRDLSVWFKDVIDVLPYDFEVAIGNYFIWVEAYFADEFLHGTFKGGFFE